MNSSFLAPGCSSTGLFGRDETLLEEARVKVDAVLRLKTASGASQGAHLEVQLHLEPTQITQVAFTSTLSKLPLHTSSMHSMKSDRPSARSSPRSAARKVTKRWATSSCPEWAMKDVHRSKRFCRKRA